MTHVNRLIARLRESATPTRASADRSIWAAPWAVPAADEQTGLCADELRPGADRVGEGAPRAWIRFDEQVAEGARDLRPSTRPHDALHAAHLALGRAMRLRPGPPPIAERGRRSGGSRAKSRRSGADSASPSSCQERADRVVLQLLAGCSFTVGVVTSCWKLASLELAFASVAGCWSRMTAHLRRSETRPRSPARRSAGYGCGIVIRERPPSAAFS